MSFLILLTTIAVLAASIQSRRSVYASIDFSNSLPGCQTFNGLDSCMGNNVTVDSSQDARAWQTPPPSDSKYIQSYQNYHDIVGYSAIQYNSLRSTCVVTVNARSRSKSDLSYSFDGGKSFSSEPSKSFDASHTLPIYIHIVDESENVLVLEPVDLLWNNPRIQDIPQFQKGQKGAIVDLFGWSWKDIELECPMLAKAGYLGVKINPSNEHLMSYDWLGDNDVLNPWYYLYQPVSYRQHSRGGSRSELRSMINKCRALGVRVYADAVVNHMTGGGNDIQYHRNQQGGSCAYWGPKSSTGGSPFFTHSYCHEYNNYTNLRPAMEYPAVPYFPSDFHCERSLNSFNDPLILDAGWLVGLADLNTAKDSVQERIAAYMTDLLSMGFSGFRWDAAKHIMPSSLAQIIRKLIRNMGGSLPDDFITWLEVIIGGEKDLLACQKNSYNFYQNLDETLAGVSISAKDISKIKIWSADYPKEHPICGSWILPASRFVIQNDDHDQQNPGSSSRDMQDKGSVLIKDRNLDRHRDFEKLLFNRRDADWAIKVVLSSYSYGPNGEMGFLDGDSDCSKYTGDKRCKSTPLVKAHNPFVCGYTCFNEGREWKPFEYTRVHRDRSIINAMREWVGLGYTQDVGIPKECQ